MKLSKSDWRCLELEINYRLETIKDTVPIGSVLDLKSKRERKKALIEFGKGGFHFPANYDVDQLNDFADAAINIGGAARDGTKTKQSNLTFILNLAEFYYACGFVVGACSIVKPDPGKMKSGKIGGEAKANIAIEKRRWVARELVRRMGALPRRAAEQELGRAIAAFSKVKILPKEFSRKWLQSLLAKDGKSLRTVYSDNHLSKEKLEQLAREPVGLPMLP